MVGISDTEKETEDNSSKPLGLYLIHCPAAPQRPPPTRHRLTRVDRVLCGEDAP